jgi:hypothetical protein
MAKKRVARRQAKRDELRDIFLRYRDINVEDEIKTYTGLMTLATRFYRDVAEIYDIITRYRNLERNPTGFYLNDAPVLGLLVRSWKLLKEIVGYYERGNGDMIAQLSRQLVEAVTVAHYLLKSPPATIEDYRKCGYKSRVETLERAARDSRFFASPPGQRLVAAIEHKLKREGFTLASFDDQRKRNWKLHKKGFYGIFATVTNSELYGPIYGYGSESLHGSWNECLDYDLVRNEDNTFRPNWHYAEADIRVVSPILRFCTEPYRLWIERAKLDLRLEKALQWTESMNYKLFLAFEPAFATTERGSRENARA